MTPFQQFRIWSRRAPAGDRVFAAAGGLVVLALVVWLTIPVDRGSGSNSVLTAGPVASGTDDTTATTVGAATGAVGGGPATTEAPGGAPNAGAAPSTGTNPGAAPLTGTNPGALASSTGGCTSPPGTDQGVTASQITIAVALVNIVGPAGNGTFGVPGTEEQQLDFQQVIDALNASGGVACRKLVARFYEANPVSSSDLQQKCLDIVQDKPLFVIDTGGFSGSPVTNCFPQHQLPFLGNGRINTAQRDQFYPYLFGQGNIETLYRNTVFALRDRGFFGVDNGFKKLGYVHRSCWPDVNKKFVGWLQQAGIQSSQISTYDVGCPQGFATPSDLQQAILKFQRDGVTHVTSTFFTQDFANFTKLAQQQRFTPRYGLADDGVIPTTDGSLHPDFDNIADAIAIDDGRSGEENTPGLAPTPATQKCDAIYKAKGRPDVWHQPVGFGGLVCALIWEVAAAISHAPSLQRGSMAAGLRAAKALELPFPLGPADFSGPKVTYGGQFWRPVQFIRACTCWRVIDATFRPEYR